MVEVVERVKGKKIVKSLVYGNTASPFGYKRDSDGHTHHWTIFLRSFNNEDLSKFIRKVQFKLHDSYTNSTRVVEKPPFEVSETGWGEFEIQIRIYFIDMNEKPVTAFHYLRLFQPVFTTPAGKSEVIAEFYDELVFQEPTVVMYNALTAGDSKKTENKKFHNDLGQVLRRAQEMAEFAKDEIQQEIDDLREALRAAHKLMLKYRGEDHSASNTPSVSMSQD